MTYMHILTKDVVIVNEEESTDVSVIYTKIKPQMINGRSRDEFVKPRHVFKRMYRLVK